MIAHVCGLKPGDFIHVMGDAHVYLNHIDALKEQITRIPTEFPKLFIKSNTDSLDNFKFEDFELVNYNPQKSIKMQMSA
jgi:thymidylate synthase